MSLPRPTYPQPRLNSIVYSVNQPDWIPSDAPRSGNCQWIHMSGNWWEWVCFGGGGGHSPGGTQFNQTNPNGQTDAPPKCGPGCISWYHQDYGWDCYCWDATSGKYLNSNGIEIYSDRPKAKPAIGAHRPFGNPFKDNDKPRAAQACPAGCTSYRIPHYGWSCHCPEGASYTITDEQPRGCRGIPQVPFDPYMECNQYRITNPSFHNQAEPACGPECPNNCCEFQY